MRLIDADAFKKYIRDACNEMSHVYKDGGKWAKQITEDFCMDIDEQPTIEECKTGKWIWETKHYKDSEQEFYYCEGRCSECGVKKKIGWAEARYCPNCGAKMEGEGDETDR